MQLLFLQPQKSDFKVSLNLVVVGEMPFSAHCSAKHIMQFSSMVLLFIAFKAKNTSFSICLFITIFLPRWLFLTLKIGRHRRLPLRTLYIPRGFVLSNGQFSDWNLTLLSWGLFLPKIRVA